MCGLLLVWTCWIFPPTIIHMSIHPCWIVPPERMHTQHIHMHHMQHIHVTCTYNDTSCVYNYVYTCIEQIVCMYDMNMLNCPAWKYAYCTSTQIILLNHNLLYIHTIYYTHNLFQSHPHTHNSMCIKSIWLLSSGHHLEWEVRGWGRVPLERWGAGVEYHFQEFNEPYAPS